MNKRQLEYAVLLAQMLNFSQAAEHLGITQPSLSKQIHHLEEELGIRIFDRSHTPMAMTPAGEHFIQGAKELIYKEEQVFRSLEQFRSTENGRLVIGATPFRSVYLIPALVRKFKEKYPAVRVVIHEDGATQIRMEAATGKFDFAIVNLPIEDSNLQVIPLKRDTLVLAVPKELAKNLKYKESFPYPIVDFTSVGDLPFVVLSPQQELRQQFDKLCLSVNLHPTVAAEVVGITTAAAMARSGIGATILPVQYIQNQYTHEKLDFFVIESDVQASRPAIVMRKDHYQTEYAKYAVQLLTETETE